MKKNRYCSFQFFLNQSDFLIFPASINNNRCLAAFYSTFNVDYAPLSFAIMIMMECAGAVYAAHVR